MKGAHVGSVSVASERGRGSSQRPLVCPTHSGLMNLCLKLPNDSEARGLWRVSWDSQSQRGTKETHRTKSHASCLLGIFHPLRRGEGIISQNCLIRT